MWEGLAWETPIPWTRKRGLGRLQGWWKVFLGPLQLWDQARAGSSACLARCGEERAGGGSALIFSEHNLLVLRAPDCKEGRVVWSTLLSCAIIHSEPSSPPWGAVVVNPGLMEPEAYRILGALLKKRSTKIASSGKFYENAWLQEHLAWFSLLLKFN